MKSLPPQPPSEPATMSDVRDGLAKLCRDIGSLQGEINELTNAIARFANGRQLKPVLFVSGLDWKRGERESTPEPRSEIRDALSLLKDIKSVDEQTLILRAISRELDGALRDVRAAKLDVRGILDDSDLRDEFRAWQDRQG